MFWSLLTALRINWVLSEEDKMYLRRTNNLPKRILCCLREYKYDQFASKFCSLQPIATFITKPKPKNRINWVKSLIKYNLFIYTTSTRLMRKLKLNQKLILTLNLSKFILIVRTYPKRFGSYVSHFWSRLSRCRHSS